MPQANMRTSSCECFKNLKILGIPYRCEEAKGENLTESTVLEKAVALPGMIRINAGCSEYPIVEETELHVVFQKMTDAITGLSDYETDVLHFWILDMFIEGLSAAQKADLSHKHQYKTLLWIAFMFNFLQLNNLPRKDVFKMLRALILIPPERKRSKFTIVNVEEEGKADDETSLSLKDEELGEACSMHLVDEIWEIPFPPTLVGEDIEDGTGRIEDVQPIPDSDTEEIMGEDDTIYPTKSEEALITEKNIQDMTVILEIMYKIFGQSFTFKLLQAAFHNTPNVQLVELPYKITKLIPKRLQQPPPQVQSGKPGKPGKSPAKILSPVKTAEEIEIERQLHKYDNILPLAQAEGTKELIQKLFNIPSNDNLLASGKGKKK